MQQENKDLAALISDLGNKFSSLSAEELPDQVALPEIRDILASMDQNIRSISSTITALSGRD